MAFNTVDWIILLMLSFGGILGAISGFISEVAQKLGYALGLFFALTFTNILSNQILKTFNLPIWLSLGISFVIIFYVVFIVVKLVGHGLEGAFEAIHLDFLDRFFGFFLGILEAIILIVLLEWVLNAQDFWNLKTYLDNSVMITKLINPLFGWIPELIGEQIV